jgi:ABC-type oligopeptide transport system substrate-binding subunit
MIAASGHDYAQLRELFHEGQKELGKSTDLSKVTLVFNTSQSSAQDKARDDYLKQVLEKNLGINIDVQVAPDSTAYKTRRNSNQFDISLNGWYADKDPSGALELWKSSYGFSKFFGYYNSDQYDEYFDELDKTSDIDKRFELYKKLEQQILTVDFGVIILTHPNEYYYVSNKLKGVSVLSFGVSFDYSRSYKVN